jgi:hypothetical protein
MSELVVTGTPSIVRLSKDGGVNPLWGEGIALHDGNPAEIVLDLGAIEFIDPITLIRLRGLIDLACTEGCTIKIVSPRGALMRNYLEWMRLGADLPTSCTSDLQIRDSPDSSKVLIPVTRLGTTTDVTELERMLEDLYLAYFEGPLALLADAFTRTIGEISDNATTHGKSSVGGAYVAAQRYSNKRCVIAVGDLGIGIAAHMGRVYAGLDDETAIRLATKEGKSGTGDPQRGFGYQYVIDGIKNARIKSGELSIWSGRSRFRLLAHGGLQARRRAWAVDESTKGTWVRVELVGQ